MTFNAPATNTSNDVGLDIEDPFGHDAEDRSSNQAGSINKRNKIIRTGTGIILLGVCAVGVGYSAAAMSSSNIARSFTMTASKSSKAPKRSKAPVATKSPKSTRSPIAKSTKAATGCCYIAPECVNSPVVNSCTATVDGCCSVVYTDSPAGLRCECFEGC